MCNTIKFNESGLENLGPVKCFLFLFFFWQQENSPVSCVYKDGFEVEGRGGQKKYWPWDGILSP